VVSIDYKELSTRIIETMVFTRQIQKLLDDESKQCLLDTLIAAPNAGDIIKGSGGLRKLRWGGSGKGKRGSIRVIYYWRFAEILYLLLAYPKNKKDDLSMQELKILSELVRKELSDG